jgi:3-oxoacyl-(acyl-carrier-protein) synthase
MRDITIARNYADTLLALAGKAGITRITRFDPSRLASQIAGEVKGFDVAPYMSPKEARRMDIFIQYGMAAALQAWREAALEVNPQNAERIGVNFGSGIGGLPLIESMHDELKGNGPRRISPFFIPGSIINMTAGLLSIEIGAKGPNLAMVTACTTSGWLCPVATTAMPAVQSRNTFPSTSSTRATPRRSPLSAVASTGSPWRWSWPRRCK